ncbi:MAG: Octanoyltransferase LipM [Phycisphaerae bacterium]|nr:Octanoyltransferase LipM [Phycisphaerae bacterium]
MRLLLDGPAPGATNMARDEALLRSVIDRGEPALRFYAWSPAAVSLGYFQPVAEWDARRAELRGLELVRRPTGGGAILHDDELTYSLSVREDLPALSEGPTQLYRLAHEAIRDGLAELGVPVGFHSGCCEGNSQRGPFFCFARRHTYDLVADGCKIVGSAQRRRGGAILQHGSIILRQTGPQPCTGVNDHAATPIDAAGLALRLAPRLADRLGVELRHSEPTADELQAAASFELQYASDAWTRQR